MGNPLFCYRATSEGERLSYARVFIEVAAGKDLPSVVQVEVDGGEKLEVPVECEWQPPRCRKCVSFRHLDSQCPIVYKEQWVAKPKTIDIIGGAEEGGSVGIKVQDITHGVGSDSDSEEELCMSDMHRSPMQEEGIRTINGAEKIQNTVQDNNNATGEIGVQEIVRVQNGEGIRLEIVIPADVSDKRDQIAKQFVEE